MIPADHQDRKARQGPTATMALPDRLAWMGLKDRKGRREMKGQRVPKARRVPTAAMVRLDRKARPEPMDNQEDRLAPKGRLDRMAPKVRRGR